MEYKSLTKEQKERAKALKSPEEMLEFAESEGIELTDEQLEGVAGGWNAVLEECDAAGDPDYR